MENKVDFEKFKGRIDPSWHEKLKPWFESEACYKLLSKLTEESKSGKVIIPSKELIWRCFRETKLEDLKIIFLGMSPYFTKGVPDGLSFSCGITNREQPSLRILLDACENDLGVKGERNPDLTRWANQGVLLLNSALTTLEGDAKSHLELWRPFLEYLFKNIFNNLELKIVYFGANAREYQALEDKKLHKSICVNHPSYFARNNEAMAHKGLFSQCNKLLKEGGKSEIKWIEFLDLPWNEEKIVKKEEYKEFI